MRVAARAEDASDRVEKTLAVLPDGEEVVQTDNRLLASPISFDLTVPDEAMPGTVHSELKVYPDLISHAFDGIEGIVRRPYGCAEQTISSSYPNLIVLRALQQSAPDSPAAREARNFLERGYRRLTRYQAAGGGFSYWGGKAEAALEVSVHAWKFLTDIQGWVDVDPKVLESTLKWLLEKQQADGSWLKNAALTGLMARSLSAGQKPQAVRQALQRAIRYLAGQAASQDDDPYLLASFVLAALQNGLEKAHKPLVRQAASRLIETARSQQDQFYWPTRHQTPFRGWGRAGEIETTAVVARALQLFSESRQFRDDPLAPEAFSKASGAVVFLLLSKDLYGVWHSTQATFAALDTLSRFESPLRADEVKAGQKLTLEATVNGHRLKTELVAGQGPPGPLWLDLSSNLVPGANRIRVESGPAMTGKLAHLVVRYRRKWPEIRQEAASNPHLYFRVHFDRDRLQLGEEVTCRVEIQRLAAASQRGSRRRLGMLLAEVGLPPGIQLNHASLKQEMERLGWVLGRYEVQPDRLVLYLWPHLRFRVELSFRFRPRLAMRARSAPSQLYDYYNPDARLSLAPALFTVSAETLGR